MRKRVREVGSIHGLVDPLDPLVWLFGLMELPQEVFAVKRWKRMFQSVGLQRDNNSTRKQAKPSCTKQRMVYGF